MHTFPTPPFPDVTTTIFELLTFTLVDNNLDAILELFIKIGEHYIMKK